MTQAIALRDYQQVAVDEIRAQFAARVLQVLLVLPTGGGKCAAAGTPVLMYDGTIRAIEKIQPGELIMGPDSRPRAVLSTCSGREMMYRVTPTKGDPYVVNESHILSLKITGIRGRVRAGDGRMYQRDDIVNIGIRDYLASSSTFKHVAKGWRTGVDFPASGTALKIPPYILGVWLGDGTEDRFVQLTNPDQPIIDAWLGWGRDLGCRVVVREQDHTDCRTYTLCGVKKAGCVGRSNPARNALRDIGVFGRRHIPHAYKTASRADRLELLAGIVDTDGYLHNGTYDVVAKSEVFANDIAFLARSLGFACYVTPCQKTCTNTGAVGNYFRLNISGDISQVPCRVERRKAAPRRQKKDVLVSGITVEPIGEGDYYGFEIDGDHLFMLGDFTVTHNTFTFSYIADQASRKGRAVCIVVHRKELLLQASASLSALGIEHGLISPHFTPNPHALVQVASVDTLLIRLKKRPYKFGLIIFDEAHHVVDGNKWGKCYELLGRPPMLGVTATPVRTDGKGLGDHAGGLFAAMVLGPSVAELIRRGALINPVVFTSLEMPDLDGLRRDKDGDYNRSQLAERVDKPRITGSAVEHYTKICKGAKAIVFCTSIAHARHVAEEFNAAGYRFELLVGAPEMSDAERTAVNRRLRRGEIHGACTVDLVSEGYDLPDLECCIMLRPTASEALYLQQVGRIMRPSPTKRGAWLLDHVGNVGRLVDGEFKRKHGLPDEAREWTLDGRKKRKGRAKDQAEPTIPLKQCPKCFLVHEPATHCPGCGHEYPAPTRALEQVDGELQQITPEMQERLRLKQRSAQAAARTVEDMMRDLGYSQKRAEAIVAHREAKRALRESLIFDMTEWRKQTGQTPLATFGVALSDLKAYKPKALKDLRERFDAHRRAHLARSAVTIEPGDDPQFGEFLQAALLPSSNQRGDAA